MVGKKVDKLRIAMIGCGNFARNFVPLFCKHPAVESVCVCDLIPSRAKEYSEEFGVPIIESFEAALESDKINAVAIFTQRYAHGPMVIQALKAGKHVYSAVPCAISVDDIREIERLVRETRLTYSMGETGFYRAATVFCRNEFFAGHFGKFVYGEAQYNHDIRNMENSYRSSGGEEWRKYAGIPPMFYPTHSTAMILGAMPGVYAKRVTALGYREQNRTDIFDDGDVNLYGNPFSNTAMLLELSNGGIARISENRCVGWRAPETYISQFYGSDGGYEFSVAHHYMAQWDPNRDGFVQMREVTDDVLPVSTSNLIHNDPEKAVQEIADGCGFTESAPIQPTGRLPKEFSGMPNGHNGTHHFLIDDFCRAATTGKLSPTNIWQVARFNIPGLLAHESALHGGIPMEVPDLGDPPADWTLLNPDRFPI